MPPTLKRTADDPESVRLREEGAQGLGWLSLNRYCAVCLNSTKVFFADIDCIPSEKNPFKHVEDWAQSVERAELLTKEEGLNLRCYRTRCGLRLIETTRLHSSKDTKTIDFLYKLGCDTAYIALTRKLDNFRVRLTPKPWRMKEGEVVDFSVEGAFDRYLKHPIYRVAAYVGTLGREGVEMPAEVAQIVALHDEACCAHNEELELA
jgi:hypothetical protein